MEELSVIGRSVTRIDALEKVTGKAAFCADFMLPGMLHARVLRSPHPHARILSIDTSKAEHLPGVKCLVTGNEAPEKRFGFGVYDQYLICKDVVRYEGDPVAAVAAESLEVAQEALGLIEVRYEELPAMFDPEDAVSTNPSVVIHPDLFNYERGRVRTLEPDRPNVFKHFKIRKGDVDKGFDGADLVMENRFSTARIQHCTLEPHGTVVKPEPDGGLTMWVGRQNIWQLKNYLGTVFGIKPSKIRIIQPYVGGGFGSKMVINEEPIVTLLALKAGRPVKQVFTREEVFLRGGSRPPMITHIKDGVKKDGTLVAREMSAVLAGGGYENFISVLTRNASFAAVGSYRVKNFKWDSYGVYVNEPPGCPFRGFGSTEVIWAIESHMDILAEKLGIDPVEFRMKNILKEGEANITGEITHSIGARECLSKVAEFIKPEEEPEGDGPWRRGKGLALGSKYSSMSTVASARVKVSEDETLIVYHSADEIGQGCNTVAAQVVAEEFGISPDNVKVVFTDTLLTPVFLGGSTSSRVTYSLGNAVKLACLDAKHKLCERASERLDMPPEVLATRGGVVYEQANPDNKVTIAELFQGYKGHRPGGYGSYIPDGEIIGHATWAQKSASENPETGRIDPKLASQGMRLLAFWTHTAKSVEVAVNTETGQVKVLSIAAAHDMGRPVNPKICEQQSEGGIAMGIGDGLYEELQVDEGIVTNPNFIDYRIPSSTEMPPNEKVKTIIAATPHKDGPYGAKGVGEGAAVGVQAAIGNAVYNAIGVRIRDLPITPEKILRALKEKGD